VFKLKCQITDDAHVLNLFHWHQTVF